MKPTEPSRRTMIYRILRDDCGLTHHQTRCLIRTHFLHLGSWSNILWREYKRDKEQWVQHANGIALLSMREDPVDAGKSILNLCWKDQEGEPEIPFTCASLSAQVVRDTMGFNDGDRRILWLEIERLLHYEERQAEIAWDERMLHAYLKIRKAI